MFGYVRPLKEELKVKEYEFYRSVYCGLCRSMKKNISRSAAGTLSYDMVFLALVRFALTDEKITFVKKRCIVSPFRKKVTVGDNASLAYCASAGTLLAYHKVADDAADKRGAGRIAAKTALLFMRGKRKKAGLPELDAVISAQLSRLSELENNVSGGKSREIDELAECFGKLLGEVFAYGLEGDKRRIASEMGFHVGKWIYYADAADDYEKDKKSGEFNPLPSPPGDSTLGCAMKMELNTAALAYELMPARDVGINAIIKNILYLGLNSKTDSLTGSGARNTAADTSEQIHLKGNNI